MRYTSSSSNGNTPPVGRNGFTMVELLVVIGVIGTLIGIILPAITRARAQAKTAHCQTNMRNLYQASVAFAADNAGGLPSPSKTGDQASNAWSAKYCIWVMDPGKRADLKVGAIWKYLDGGPSGTAAPPLAPDLAASRQQMIWCPTDNAEIQETAGNKGAVDRNFSYSINYYQRGEVKDSGNVILKDAQGGDLRFLFQLRRVKNPSQRIMIFEEVGPNDSYCVMRPQDVNQSNDDRMTGRHGKVDSLQYGSAEYDAAARCNVTFYDGHVEIVSPGNVGGDKNWYAPLETYP